MTLNHKTAFGICVAAFSLLIIWTVLAQGRPFRKPSQQDLEQTVGTPVRGLVTDAKWATGEPTASPSPIHRIVPSRFDEARFLSIAKTLGFTNSPEPIPITKRSAPGVWIREAAPVKFGWRSLAFSEAEGSLTFGSGDDGWRYDAQAKRPVAPNVPTREEAFEKALSLLDSLGISTNEIGRRADGSLRWSYVTSTTGFMDRATRKTVTIPFKATITFSQRIPGGSTYSVGSSGLLRIDFVSEGKLSGIESFIRKVEPCGSAQPRSKEEILKMVQRGAAHTWKTQVPASVTITNCIVGYPLAAPGYSQEFAWPFHWLMATGRIGDRQESLYLFVPFRYE